MEYRRLPHGTNREKFGVLGLGMGGIAEGSRTIIQSFLSTLRLVFIADIVKKDAPSR